MIGADALTVEAVTRNIAKVGNDSCFVVVVVVVVVVAAAAFVVVAGGAGGVNQACSI